MNWVVALRLRARLQRDGIRVVMTKAREHQRVTNRARAETANAAHAALFLRLHCDAGAGSGTAIYYPDRQGRAQGHVGPDPAVIRSSAAAARRFHPALMARLSGVLPDRGIHGDSATFVGGKQGALTGSVFSQVPALTVEMCVLTNRHDEALAGSADGQALLAQGLEAGVLAVLGSRERIPVRLRPGAPHNTGAAGRARDRRAPLGRSRRPPGYGVRGRPRPGSPHPTVHPQDNAAH